jgi:hypothetical protein
VAFSGKLKPLRCFVFLGLLTALPGCAASSGQGSGPEKSPAAQAVSPGGAPQGAASPTAPAVSDSSTPPEARESPKAPAELKEKLQPGGKAAQAPVKPDESTLKAEAEVFVKRWLEALQKGDLKEAEKFAVSSDLLAKTMNPGYRDIIEGTVLSQNRLLMERLVSLLRGKEIQHDWKPGILSETPAEHIFASSAPCLSNGILQVDASGIVAEIRLDQLFYLDGQWKIFRLSVP